MAKMTSLGATFIKFTRYFFLTNEQTHFAPPSSHWLAVRCVRRLANKISKYSAFLGLVSANRVPINFSSLCQSPDSVHDSMMTVQRWDIFSGYLARFAILDYTSLPIPQQSAR